MLYKPDKTIPELLEAAEKVVPEGVIAIVDKGLPHEKAHEKTYELEGEYLQTYWEQVVEQAKTKATGFFELFELIRYTNREQFNELNTVFIKKRSKKDLPSVCPSCKTTEFTDDIQLKGIYPTLNKEVEWFKSDCGWSLQLLLRDSFYGFNPIEDPTPLNEKPEMRIGEFRCPSCDKKHSEEFAKILADF